MARRKTYASEDGSIQKLVGNHDHASAVRARIINSAKCLLAEEGYSKTTIRKIVEHSGILTGSIYYFFKNKEDIFHAILLELMRDCIRRINLRFKNESPLFIYAAVCQVELKVLADNQIVRDSYKKGYDSIIIFEGMIAQFHEMARNLFNGTKYDKRSYACLLDRNVLPAANFFAKIQRTTHPSGCRNIWHQKGSCTDCK